MARPERNTVDYFPLYCKDGKGIYYIEQKYGNDGYATWLKILCQLATTDYHYIDLSNEIQFMFLSAKCKIDKKILESIINDLVILGEFDKELWNENKVIFSEKFIASIKDAYDKRNNTCIDRNSLLLLLTSLGVRKPSKSIPKPSKSTSEVPVKPHTILDYTKEDKTKVYREFKHLKLIDIDFDKLIDLGYKKNQIDDILDSIENFKNNTKYTNLFLTAKTWLKKEFGINNKSEQNSIDPNKTYQYKVPNFHGEMISQYGTRDKIIKDKRYLELQGLSIELPKDFIL